MDKSKYSPMMQHYLEMKEQYPDTILFYRLGDFYEMFFEDAKVVSRELDLVLTAKAAGAEKAPMCGVPHHSVQNYISRLIHKGYKIAICEQLEDPADAKGLVQRGVVRIVTPGTFVEEEVNLKTSNYLAVLHVNGYQCCLIFCELSTGELLYQICDRSLHTVRGYLQEMNVSEIVADHSVDKSWVQAFEKDENLVFSYQKGTPLHLEDEKLLSVKEEIVERTLEILMGYLQKTQMKRVEYLQPMHLLHPMEKMQMDAETRKHLELIQAVSGRGKSLWEFMDCCRSCMGSRKLRSWLKAPLVRKEEILKRQQAVQELLDQFLLREQLKDHLSFIYDLERLASRISYGSAGPRDVLQLVTSLEHAGPVLELCEGLSTYPELKNVDPCTDLYEELKDAIVEDPPVSMKDGGFIAPGFDAELDRIRQMAENSQEEILQLETREREKTGIRNLKIGYNRVFGYYIDVRKSSVDLIKADSGYTQKQTLANSARFVTAELKELENEILNAQDRKVQLEHEIFDTLIQKIKIRLTAVYELAQALSEMDVLYALAQNANDYGYIRPEFNEDHCVEIVEGRHPIMEQILSGYVSNDWQMQPSDNIHLITGPNMGGKSTYLRQNALLVIMAQIGSFIPASKACLPVFDRIFTRIGANDDIMMGKSTFMVEMLEANTALRYATRDSLILFDEIGRGTATYDGMALAQAMLEYIDEAIQAKTLFSTHYHELTTMSDEHMGITNVHVDVKEKKNEIQFLYRIVEGKADKSYGIHVARLAALPEAVLTRAASLLNEYENQNSDQNYQPSLFIMDRPEPRHYQVIEKLENLDVDSLSPREALDCLYALQKLADSSD